MNEEFEAAQQTISSKQAELQRINEMFEEIETWINESPGISIEELKKN